MCRWPAHVSHARPLPDPAPRWIRSVLANRTPSRVACLGLVNGEKPGLSCCSADQRAGRPEIPDKSP